MRKTKQWLSGKIEEIAKKVASNTVGKSYYMFSYEREIPENVKKWTIESKGKK